MTNYLNNDACMPLIFANGFPAQIHNLKEEQLECFLKYLWDFTDVPSAARFLPPISINPKTRINNLKTVIRNVYARLGCKYLLHLSEGIALRCDKKAIVFEHVTVGNMKMVNLYDLRGMHLIVTVPRSNLTYDMAIRQKYAIMPETKKKFIFKRSRVPSKLKSLPSSKEVINLDSDGEDDVIVLDSDEAASIEEEPSELKATFLVDSNNTEKEPPSDQNKSSILEKSIIKSDTKYVAVRNESNKLILIPKHVRQKIPQTDCTVPKIEFAVSLPSDDPSNAYYISSESESESESLQEDPFSDVVPVEDANMVVLISDSDSESNEPVEPTKVSSPAKGTSHSKSILFSPSSHKVPPLCSKRSSFTSQSKREYTPREKSFVASRNKNIQRTTGLPKGQTAKGSILGTNKTYSQIKYSREQQQLSHDNSDSDCELREPYNVDDHRSASELEDKVEDKVSYMNSLGLLDKDNSDSVDDLIILPEINKKDFMKFHRFCLNMVPYLVSRELIDDKCVCPGEPGQNSCYTSTTNINLSLRRSYRGCTSSARYRSLDRKKARNYIFPKKTYRTRPPVPFPFPKKKQNQGQSKPGPLSSKCNKVPKTNKIKKHKIAENLGVSKPKSKIIGPKLKGILKKTAKNNQTVNKSVGLEDDNNKNVSKSITFHGFPPSTLTNWSTLKSPSFHGLSTLETGILKNKASKTNEFGRTDSDVKESAALSPDSNKCVRPVPDGGAAKNLLRDESYKTLYNIKECQIKIRRLNPIIVKRFS